MCFCGRVVDFFIYLGISDRDTAACDAAISNLETKLLQVIVMELLAVALAARAPFRCTFLT